MVAEKRGVTEAENTESTRLSRVAALGAREFAFNHPARKRYILRTLIVLAE